MKIRIILFVFFIGFIFSCKQYSVVRKLNNGLVAYYPFNGNANDESGNGNNGVVNGAVLTDDRNGNTQSAYYFDGNSPYIDLGNSDLIKRTTNDYSVSLWFNLNSYSTSYCSVILSNRNDLDYTGSMIEIAGALSPQYKQIIFYKNYLVTSDTTTADFLNSISTVDLGRWYHICMTYKYNGGYENLVKIYVDGQLASTKKISTTSYPGSRHTFVGNEPKPFSDYSFIGSIDEIRFYNRELSESEIEKLSRLK